MTPSVQSPSEPELPGRPVGVHRSPVRTAWPWVLCVVGLDYLSTLAYQPSIAVAAAGKLAPVVTLGVVAVTLLLVVPLYCYLAGRSPHGLGSTGLLERLVPGWFGKFLVLTVLGFAATDLVFTRTFSAADAAEHLLHSPVAPWQDALAGATERGGQLADGLGSREVVVTLFLLLVGSAVGWVFRRGVTRGLVRMAVAATGVYLVLTGIVVGSGLAYLADHPGLVEDWWRAVQAGDWKPGAQPWPVDDWWPVVAACVLMFPQLALGLSGYELALTAMPMIRGRRGDDPRHPRGRIFRTRLLLVTAAVLMAVLLLASTLVTTVLVPADAVTTHGRAANRATAYLAHGGELAGGVTPADVSPLYGPWLGGAYDLAAVAVLTLAGITMLIGMRDLIPPYLYRLGMDWKWSQRWGLLMYLFTVLKLGVTYVYRADLDAQRGAYLTGVLGVFAFGAFTGLIDVWKGRAVWRKVVFAPPFLLALAVFVGSAAVVIHAQPAGLTMAAWFVGVTLLVSMVTRFFRSTELRFRGFEYADEKSRHIWEDLVGKDYPIIVPVRPDGPSLADKEAEIRKYHRLPATMAVVFLKVDQADASDFYSLPLLTIEREGGRVVAHITRAASVPHVIAAAALEVARYGVVPEVHFGWSAENPLTANLNFVLFGMGNVPWMAHELIQAADFPKDRKPRVMVG